MTESQFNKKVEQCLKYKNKIDKIYDEIMEECPEWADELTECLNGDY
jgi:hypothetical protein